MIRNVIKATLFFAVVISACSVTQVTMALDLSLENNSSVDLYYPFAWIPDRAQSHSGQNGNSILTLPGNTGSQNSDNTYREFSLEIYQGEDLEELRRSRNVYHKINLPDEDTDAFGISIKQRF